MRVLCYYESAHLLKHRSEHTCVSIIYSQVDLVMKEMCCKAQYAVNLKHYPTLQDAVDHI